MANLSDAFGTIEIKRVGKEFIDFLNKVQNQDAYYLLASHCDYEGVEPDAEGSMSFKFSTSGRWSYSNNLEGYLKGEWMNDNGKLQEAYKEFTESVIAKKGVVTIDYADSDTAMDWMGYGSARLSCINDKINFFNSFNEEEFTLQAFAEMQDETELWALEYVYGEEVAEAYDKYLIEWKINHSGPEYEGMHPACPSEWYDNDYQPEE